MSLQCPITINVSREILAGKETIYENWIHRGTQLICQFPGFLGMNIKRPDSATNNCYQLTYSFDTAEHQAAWKNSAQRSNHMKLLKNIFIKKETSVQKQEELILPTLTSQQKLVPNPHKMALVLIVVVFSVLFPLNAFFGQYIVQLPLPLRILSVVLPQVLLMNYIIMPPLMKWLHPWLTRKLETKNLS